MKKRVKFLSFMSLMFGFFCLFLAASNQLVGAIDYVYGGGKVSETNENTVVYEFAFDYTSRFTEQTGYYNGVDIKDKGESLKDKYFYSAQFMTININHVDKKLIWSKDDDKTTIYKYSVERMDFNAKVASFVNEAGVHTLKDEGIYKIEYIFEEGDDEKQVVYTNYVYINPKLHAASVTGHEKYNSTSAYVNFSFLLTLKDAYDLRFNEYYYAFGVSDSNLNYKSFTAFTNSEKNSSTPIYSVQDRPIGVTINEGDETRGSSKHLFIKIVKNVNGNKVAEVISTNNRFELVKNLEAHVYVTNSAGEKIEGETYFKAGDTINFELQFNAPVTFDSMNYSIDGGNNFIYLPAAKEEITVYRFSHYIEEIICVVGELKLRNHGEDAIVELNEFNTPLTVVTKSTYYIDSKAPTFSIEGDEITDIAKGSYFVDLKINEDKLSEVSYYVSECKVSQGNYCSDVFDEKSDKVRKIDQSTIDEFNLGILTSIVITIDEELVGKQNGQKLVLLVRTKDVAGNMISNNKYGYLIDNVIVPEDQVDNLFNEKEIKDGETVTGKELNIVVEEAYKVSKVYFTAEGGEELECNKLSELQEGKVVYNCYAVNYNFTTTAKIKLIDEYNNEEEYTHVFKYSNLTPENGKDIGGFTINVYNNQVYDLEITNIDNVIGNDQTKITLSADVVSQLEGLLQLESIPNLTDKKKDLVYINGEVIIPLVVDFTDTLTLPSTIEILEALSHIDGYKQCAVKGNTCDIDIYMQYSYKTNNLPQVRFVKIILADNSLKFDVENFEASVEVDVKGNFTELSYKIVDNVNMEVDKANVNITKVIKYVAFDGVETVVDAVDMNKLGVYKISEIATFGSQSSFPLNYEIKVLDRVAPVVKLNVSAEQKINVGKDLGDLLSVVSVNDNYDTDLTIQYEWDKEYDKNTVGTYVLSYWAVDSSGNKSDVITRTIIVERDNNIKTYVIVGGIAFVVIAIMVIGIVVEVKKTKKS